MYICIFNGITDREIRACAETGACSVRELESSLGVGVSCGRCREAAGEILAEFIAPAEGRFADASPA